MQQPPLIKYNLKERGRKFRGQERDFNIKALCDSINGPHTQERVKTRAMLGYFGHKPRILLDSLEPSESVVINGVYNEIEPAIVTTFLKAYQNGDIEHQTEFLDSASGVKAATMWANKIGGFSSAIDNIKSELYGFDWVYDPNYSTNRGYTLDSLNNGLTMDAVIEEVRSEQDEFWFKLLEAKDNQITSISAALDSATVDNEHLMSMLTKVDTQSMLDSTSMLKPIFVSLDSATRMQRDKDFFRKTAQLPTFIDPVTKESVEQQEKQDNYNDFLNRLGYR